MPKRCLILYKSHTVFVMSHFNERIHKIKHINVSFRDHKLLNDAKIKIEFVESTKLIFQTLDMI